MSLFVIPPPNPPFMPYVLVILLLQDSYGELLLLLEELVLLRLGDCSVYFRLLKKLEKSPAGLITGQVSGSHSEVTLIRVELTEVDNFILGYGFSLF